MTPLVLLVGFLGSGKTSLLRKTLPALKARGITSKVILNDYQNARVDSAALADMVNTIVPIAGSCVCCESKEELLNELINSAEREGEILFVETNGTTDSMQLVEMVLFNEQVKAHYHPVIQVTVVDAKRWQKRVWHNELERLQVKTATHLLLNWQDAVGGGRLGHVRRDIEELNHQAQFVSHEELLEVLADALNVPAPESGHEHHHHAEGETCHECEGHDHDHHHEHNHDHEEHEGHHHHHDHEHMAHGFVSVQFEPIADLTREELTSWWRGLPEGVLRAKGTLPLGGESAEFHYFQALAGNENPHFEEMQANQWTRPLIVLIGCGMTEDELLELSQSVQSSGVKQA